MARDILQSVILDVWSDGTYTVHANDHTLDGDEGNTHFERTEFVGIALTRVLRAVLVHAEIKISPAEV